MTHKEKKPHHPYWAWLRKFNSELRKWKEHFDKRNGWEWFFFPPSLIVSRLYERLWVSVTTDSVFIEWSNPGSPCCLVHCLSLCSLPIWLSTALQVARTTSPHCYEYDSFWPELSISDHDYELLWMSSPQSPQRTVMTFITFPESPTAATDDVFPFEFPVLKGLCWVRNLLVCTLLAETFSAVEWLSLILWLPLIAIKQPEIPFMLSDFHFSLSLTEILILKFKGDKYPYFCSYLCKQCFQ